MGTDLLSTLAGLLLLIAGGEMLVRGVSSLALRLGISTLVIGLTVVAFGTSAPELAVNVSAVLNGSSGLPFGNIFGSNLANLGLIIAIAALIRPLDVRGVVIRRELPMMMLATLLATVLGLDEFFENGPNRFAGSDGAVFLLLFCVFLYYTGRDMLADRARRTRELRWQRLARARAASASVEHPEESDTEVDGTLASILLTIAGIVGLVIGGSLTVSGAEGLARAAGVSDAIIGLTLVAFGTSLPELVASVIACLRGHTDLAVGNVVGSNIFNLLAVLGITASIGEIPVPPGGLIDVAAVVALSLLFWVLTITARGQLIRAEGMLLLTLYVGYLGVRVFSQSL